MRQHSRQQSGEETEADRESYNVISHFSQKQYIHVQCGLMYTFTPLVFPSFNTSICLSSLPPPSLPLTSSLSPFSFTLSLSFLLSHCVSQPLLLPLCPLLLSPLSLSLYLRSLLSNCVSQPLPFSATPSHSQWPQPLALCLTHYLVSLVSISATMLPSSSMNCMQISLRLPCWLTRPSHTGLWIRRAL